MQKQLFIRVYCEHFTNANAVDAQNFFKIYILGQVSMQKWARYLLVKNIDTYYGWLFEDNEDFE